MSIIFDWQVVPYKLLKQNQADQIQAPKKSSSHTPKGRFEKNKKSK